MGEHQTWLDYFPGFSRLEAFFKVYLGRQWSNAFLPPQEHFSMVPVFLALFVAILLIFTGFKFRKKVFGQDTVIPEKSLNYFSLLDFIFDWIYKLIHEFTEDEENTKILFPYGATIFLYLFASNTLSLIPGLASPTAHMQMNLAVALSVFFMTHYLGIKIHGWSYVKELINPLEFVGHLVRPLSLTIRLLGNMFADHKVLAIFMAIFPLFIPLPFLFLGFLVSFIQALIFMMLSVIYFSMAISEEH
jgi:F-type H+-transporting ATPase subunit a